MPNLDTIFDKTFRYATAEARRFYFQTWRKAQPPCPAFAGEVIQITHFGWEHITHAERPSKLDVLGRFFVLERAKVLLETATSFQDYRKEQDMEFWELSGVIEDVKIVVVIRAIKGGSKHFFSVIRRGTVK
jgi:hypothetical protein